MPWLCLKWQKQLQCQIDSIVMASAIIAGWLLFCFVLSISKQCCKHCHCTFSSWRNAVTNKVSTADTDMLLLPSSLVALQKSSSAVCYSSHCHHLFCSDSRLLPTMSPPSFGWCFHHSSIAFLFAKFCHFSSCCHCDCLLCCALLHSITLCFDNAAPIVAVCSLFFALINCCILF